VAFAEEASVIAIYGIMYGMKRTTIYLPDEMKADIEREAARRGVTEAEVIRIAVGEHLETRKKRKRKLNLPLFPEGFGEDLAGRVDEILEGMADDLMEEM
jgi:Arc/MetJ-type ribon-helix-helix transcriptional regulator